MKKIILIVSFFVVVLNAEVLTFKTLKNEYIKIDNHDGVFSFRNKMYQNMDVLLFFFGRDCPHCKQEMPQILDLVRNRRDLQVIGIHGQSVIGDPALADYVRKTGIRFNVLSFDDDIKIINHLKNRNMWINQVPFYVHIDKSGKLHPLNIEGVLEKF
jgi:peroxiredoxin